MGLGQSGGWAQVTGSVEEQHGGEKGLLDLSPGVQLGGRGG